MTLNYLDRFDIAREKGLQAVYYILVVDLLFTLNSWISAGYLSIQSVNKNEAVCWPYFQGCLDLYVFNSIPFGYSLNILYAVLGVFVFTSLYFAYTRQWDKALLSLIVPVVFKFLMIFVFSYSVVGNYNVISVLLSLLLLFSTNKLHNLKVLFTAFYFCAAVIKLNDGYLSGTVFSSLEHGAPLLPDALLPFSGFVLVLLFTVAPVLLWFNDRTIRLWAVGALTVFHLYSVILVGFRYPALCIPILWILFIFAEHEKFSWRKLFKDKFSLLLVILVLVAQSLPFFISGDEHISSEGEKYGFYMYTANRQCMRTINVVYRDGTRQDQTYEERRGMRRCDPYEDWFVIQNICKKENVSSVEWMFNVSVNGSYFYKLVDTKNACEITQYKPFKHNEWLQLDQIDKNIPVLRNSI